MFGEVDHAYPWLDAYWRAGEARWPYLIDRGGALAGFALVNTHAPSGEPVDHAMAEFYVQPADRRGGVGREAAIAVLRRHPGAWELSAMRANETALRFWPAALQAAGAAGLRIFDRDDVRIFRFVIG
ncbi:MAG TPA: GNAT family N-acetyltransferase [Devosia sp.]